MRDAGRSSERGSPTVALERPRPPLAQPRCSRKGATSSMYGDGDRARSVGYPSSTMERGRSSRELDLQFSTDCILRARVADIERLRVPLAESIAP